MFMLATLIFLNAHADKFSYSPQKIAAKGIQQIKISGVKGRLSIKEKATKFYRIRVSHSKDKRFEDWSLSADRVHDALVLEVFNVAQGAQFKKSVKQDQFPEFDIELEGPSVPAVIGWREGKIEISGWSQGLELSFLNGSVESDRTKGVLKLEAADAKVKIRNHKGRLELRGEKGDVELFNLAGESKIAWLAGNLKGDGLTGTVELDWASGKVNLNNVLGKLKGKSGSAEWDIRARAPAELDISSDSGAQKFKWLGGGVKYFMTSLRGKLVAGPICKLKTSGEDEVCEGLKKGKPRGEVFARAKSGAVSLQIP